MMQFKMSMYNTIESPIWWLNKSWKVANKLIKWNILLRINIVNHYKLCSINIVNHNKACSINIVTHNKACSSRIKQRINISRNILLIQTRIRPNLNLRSQLSIRINSNKVIKPINRYLINNNTILNQSMIFKIL